MSEQRLDFNKPYLTGKETQYIAQALASQKLAGDGAFTKLCHDWFERHVGCARGLLTHSCTASLEMSAMLCDVRPGDEVIMPSYTFASTANAFALRGAVPVFVDVRKDTMNLDEALLEQAITPRTKVIVPVHYAGVACEMDAILAIARQHGIRVVEDAAQGIMANYKGRPLGSLGDLGTFSFHETKNVISGEGGALLVNHPELAMRAEIIREKGTDRSRFFRGEVDKYTWQEAGSSYLPSELIAAFLWAQLESARDITEQRLAIWDRYHDALGPLEARELLRRPIVPDGCEHNAHMYYVLLPASVDRRQVIEEFRSRQIYPVSHYVPLHSAPAGLRYGRVAGSMAVTDQYSERLLRLPFWVGLTPAQQDTVAEVLEAALHKRA
ncbi:dTDP-4-amino-4,6-dideoxygalactose transaminase [Achromobacter xylosoxidans]|uniref:dTDP-4-amino-4,6-dideoxygalactose transaminase n=1 Tax=Alcaligenes xylosoxydans xylosoxydans TaxID=85698 RepID=UPI000B489B33|nr:dTDP-4-amino-4,6-dideoxygalactose transaminase [Achromobacter xylosoxidans]